MSSSGFHTSSLGLTIDRLFELVNYIEYTESPEPTPWESLVGAIRYMQPRIDDREYPIQMTYDIENIPDYLRGYLMNREKQIIDGSKKDTDHDKFLVIQKIQRLYCHLLVRLCTDCETNEYIKRTYAQEAQLGNISGHMHQFIQALHNLNILIYPYNNDDRWFTMHNTTNSILLYSWRTKGINPRNPTGLVMTKNLISFTSTLIIAQDYHGAYPKRDIHDECLLVLRIPIQYLTTAENELKLLLPIQNRMNPGCTHRQYIDQIFPAGFIPMRENNEDEILAMPGVMLRAIPWGPELGDVYMEAIQTIIQETRKLHKCDDFKLNVVELTYEGYDGTGAPPHRHLYTNNHAVY